MKTNAIRAAVAAAVLTGALATGASANAATWHAKPAGGTFSGVNTTGVASPANTQQSYLKIGSTQLTCAATSATGKLTGSGGGTVNGPAYPGAWSAVASVTPAFSSCKVGGTAFTVTCASATLNAASTTATTATSGTTTGSITGISCQLKIGGVLCKTITGSVPGTYNNSTKVLTVSPTGQSLTSSGSSCATIPAGSAKFTSDAAGSVGVGYKVTPTGSTTAAPSIWES